MALIEQGAGPKLLKPLNKGMPCLKQNTARAMSIFVTNEDNKVTLISKERAPNS